MDEDMNVYEVIEVNNEELQKVTIINYIQFTQVSNNHPTKIQLWREIMDCISVILSFFLSFIRK